MILQKPDVNDYRDAINSYLIMRDKKEAKEMEIEQARLLNEYRKKEQARIGIPEYS